MQSLLKNICHVLLLLCLYLETKENQEFLLYFRFLSHFFIQEKLLGAPIKFVGSAVYQAYCYICSLSFIFAKAGF